MPRERKRAREEELKFFDTALSFSVDFTAEVPATGQLALIPQGFGDNERIGEVIRVRKIDIHGWATASMATAGMALGEIWLMLDRQPNGAAAAISQVIETGTNLVTAMPNQANQGRFVRLARIPLEMQSRAGVSTAFGANGFIIDQSIDCDIPLEYAGSATEIPLVNNLFLVAGAGAASWDDLISILATCRVHFQN